jgi:1,4-dihydroxy-2-naphthoate polyprenyltransferase
MDSASALPAGGWRLWLMAARPRTLWAAVAPVIVGTGLAFEAGMVHWPSAVLALLGAMLIQVGTNFANDYHDFLKGADTSERLGPVRVTQAGLVSPAAIRLATVVAFGLATLAGAYLMWRGGLPIVIIGVLSIAFGVLYTASRYSLAYLGLGDLFVLVFFGPVAVGGTFYVQALALPPYVLAAGLGPGLLATAILVVNNVRDIDGDRIAGKQTLVVRFGRGFGAALYAVCIVSAALLPVMLWVGGYARPGTLLASLIIIPGLGVARRVRLETGSQLNPLLGRTAQLLLLYSILFTIGWNL